VLFRDCILSDISGVTAIYAHYVLHSTASFEVEPPDGVEIAARWGRVVESGLPWIVAESEGEIAGYAYASPYRPRAAYRFTVEDSIYVHPAQVGKGLGAALLSRVIERCEGLGVRQMIAVIGGSENLASIRLHERFGFRHAGVLRSAGYKFGRWVDSVLMQRAIGPGDTRDPSAR